MINPGLNVIALTMRIRVHIFVLISLFLVFLAGPARADWKRYGFSLADSNGTVVTHERYSNRLVFMEVWATWCAPCIAGFPTLQKLHDEFAGSDRVAVITVHYGRQYGRYGSAAGFLKSTGYRFPVIQDADGVLTKKLNRLPFLVSVPKYVLFDRDGSIAERYDSLDDETIADVRRRFNHVILRSGR